MLDTKNFTMKTGVRTFEAAAFLRRAGADTIEVKCLFADNMDDYFDRCDIIKTAEKYRAAIAIALLGEGSSEGNCPHRPPMNFCVLRESRVPLLCIVLAGRHISADVRWAKLTSRSSWNGWAAVAA